MFQNLCENTETAERETLSPKFTPKEVGAIASPLFLTGLAAKIKTAVFSYQLFYIYILCFLKYLVCSNSWDLWLNGSPKYSLYNFII